MGCDHMPVVANFRLKLKKVEKKKRVRKDWKKLKNETELKEKYALEVKNSYGGGIEEITYRAALELICTRANETILLGLSRF